ncbi:glycoside hydrolase family 3 protein [Microbacterium invictum]|uniref:beta-glucosidase n=1 Tax=Microbacterium invictum TaxID=515415 RepID=A0AA40VLJ2_9MICO|nr:MULTISPECIES: glycoside hydrolase family 3 N-terminal domain-containing protein [Microbacterium]MBB4138664.1 beta-glucosidase [Microbacterium invictum]
MITSQPAIRSHRKPILEVDGLEFRDLDGDGALTPYEDWRLAPRERARDLTGRLSAAQKAGLMIIGSHYMAGSPWVAEHGGMPDLRADPSVLVRRPAPDETGSFLRAEDGYARHQMITGEPLDAPRLHASSSRGAVHDRHQRRFIVRDNPSAGDLARWANELQELAEDTQFGIPVMLVSNPRNHVGTGGTLGIREATGVFSEWPGELGLAAIGDEALVRRFAEIARREWRAAGLHKIYGYMADVPSEPRWSRFDGTLGEDPEAAGRLIAAMVRGFQGAKLDAESVALTVKHFPGGGVRTDGHDPHFAWGQENEYPTAGSLEKYQLPPFRAAIDAGVASVMPYYSKPVNTSADQLPTDLRADDGRQFEEVAFAYNKALITGLLRERLGFTGYVNTDSGVLDGMAWGVQGLTSSERWAKIIRAGSNVVSDEVDPAGLLAALAAGIVEEHELDASVALLLEEMFALGLFENPYVDPAHADEVAADAGTREEAEAAQRRSVTLLRNDRGLLPLPKDISRVYVEAFARNGAAGLTAMLREAVAAQAPGAVLIDDPADADAAIVWLVPAISLFGGDDRPDVPLTVTLPDRGIDTERVRDIQEAVPTVLVINFTNPWVIADVEPAAAAVVATYGISAANLSAVLFGDDEPRGRLPLTVPADEAAVADSPRDVPGMFCGPDYAYVDSAGHAYTHGFGLGRWAARPFAGGYE